MNPKPSRTDDELILSWVKARASGQSSHVIAARHGVRPKRVRTATSRVMQDDLETQDIHDLSDRAAAYWDTSTRARA